MLGSPTLSQTPWLVGQSNIKEMGQPPASTTLWDASGMIRSRSTAFNFATEITQRIYRGPPWWQATSITRMWVVSSYNSKPLLMFCTCPRTWPLVKRISWISLTLFDLCSTVSLSNNVFKFVSWEHLDSISFITFVLGRAIDPDLQKILHAAGDMLSNSAAKIKLFLSYLQPFGTVSSICSWKKIIWKWGEF